MPMPKLITRPRKLTLHIPEDVMTRLDLYLISLSKGKVPQGGYQRFFVERIEEFFARLRASEPTEIILDVIEASGERLPNDQPV